MKDEFYIGYLDNSPPGLARRTRWLLLGLGLVVAGLMALFAARQTPADPGKFEYGVARAFEGVLQTAPVPTLRTVNSDGSVTRYVLVGSGKFGLPDFARHDDGQRVRFKGSLIQKGGAVMIEVNDEKSWTVLGPATEQDTRATSQSLGHVVWVGELVDTKCYYGVMRPGAGKVHRACAVRCLSGGVPPGLWVRDDRGGGVVALLCGPQGQPLKFDVEWAARLVKAEGQLSWRDGLPVLEVERLSLAGPDDDKPEVANR